MNENNKWQSNLPYPEVRVLSKNLYYASLLKEDYAGLVSEMTAINQYLYHHFDINGLNKQISETLRKIAIVEMNHLETLGELILLLGDKPTYSAQNKPWNATFVYYGNDIINQLKSDLKGEYQAIQNYTNHINLINDPYIKEILARIILDEEIHVQVFTYIINSLV